MEVKCPKCRLRFDVPATPGIREVQCNCPRCGTPFTFSCPVDENGNGKANEETQKDEKSKEESQVSSNVNITQDGTVDKNNGSTAGVKSTSTAKADIQQVFLDSREPLTRQEIRRRSQSKHSKHLLTIVIAVIVCIVCAVAKGMDMVVGYLTDNDRAMSERLAVDSSERIKADSTTTVQKQKPQKTEEKKKGRSSKKKKESEALPQWLQGKWHVYSSTGYITMHIKGSRITVSDAFHSNRGKVHARGKILVCRYDDGRTFRYNLDRKNHRIIVQDKMVMKKED